MNPKVRVGFNPPFCVLFCGTSQFCLSSSCLQLGHMVTEASVMRMFCNRHQLHAVVAHALDAWQHVTEQSGFLCGQSGERVTKL